jgi:hypothetical protein
MARIAHFRDCLKKDFFKYLPTLTDLLSAEDIVTAAIEANYSWRDRVWNPVLTIWTFLIQVLHPDAPCREAVAAVLAEAGGRTRELGCQDRKGIEDLSRSECLLPGPRASSPGGLQGRLQPSGPPAPGESPRLVPLVWPKDLDGRRLHGLHARYPPTA